MSNLIEEDKKRIGRILDELINEPYCGKIESRRSGCMLVLLALMVPIVTGFFIIS